MTVALALLLASHTLLRHDVVDMAVGLRVDAAARGATIRAASMTTVQLSR